MPRRQILSNEEQDRLLVIPDDEIILTRMCFLNANDIALINKHRRPANRLGFAVLLCYLRGPGFLPDKNNAPHNGVVSRIASQLKVSSDLWHEYASREQTRWEHLTELYRYLKLSPFNQTRQKDCIRHLHSYAMRTDKGFMLAEEMLSWLHSNNVIFPSVEVIERTLAEVVTLADRSVFSTLTASLEEKHKLALDSLLISEGEQPSRLAWLLQPPGKINGKNVLQHIDRLNAISALGLPEGITLSVHQNRLLKLAREGRKMSSRDLTKFADTRRYATLVCVIQEARATLTDEIIELHERIIGSLFSRAKRTQAEKLQLTGKLIQNKLKQYVTVGQALLQARESGEDPWAAIEDVLPWQEFINSLEETRFLSRKDNFDPLHLITEKYSTLRKYAPRMLSALQFIAAPAAQALSDALDTIREMYRKQLRKVPAAAPTGFIPESWRKLVLTPSGIDRKYYEFCVLNELKGALRSGDIWVKGSRRYRNFDDYLIPATEFEKFRHDNQLQLAVQTDCQSYLQARLTLLASRLEEVNAMALSGELPDVEISDKGVKITPLENSVPSEASPFADLVYGMLPHPKITEILEEVDSWAGFTHHFTHLKNNNVRPKDKKLLLTTILADGINLGLTKMAESCPGATKSSLEGIQAWYIRDETYSSALAELVNIQKTRPLAAFWGDGTTSSSDGQNFRVGSHGRYAGQVNLKYGQEPGVQIYTHISDQYSPFYTKVISRVRDSTHVLDGLLYHESDLEIREHYTDTAGFTEHVFALMHLLGFAFAPRIRDLHDKRLFIPGKTEQYPGLQSLISTTRLNIKDIESHWNEVLRLASSIKQGTVTASLMMKKLASYPKQNGLAKALREIGRIERTLFMLDWFRDPSLRRRVQAGLNKGEARNALSRAVFMHRLGEIRDRGLENQSYRASGLTLLTSAIALWNTVYIERAIDSLKRKGISINEHLVSHLSPLGWEHINLSGDYVWRNNVKLGVGKYRPLRPVDIDLYKKQS
ncbi:MULTISPECIES: Tn3 family transposase [unclassified Photorhabdus]|uniref:Tn3 family transposase n=1 Tax=unclassified Photorhabdus TaxID=2620880 RepID=UPI000DCE6366|nr:MULTISPECIES: Tn3 family transposase [unclassified Photorhabdus]RAW96813.1 Tn3 family transposase [Photorhabdus sp. S10-54]RAW97291.1 Tn3 family transposase [Photorhabdus sp. S9-53]RAX01356.1 Tn3 family transposase [Photorhabdus sp. S8-52]